LTHLHELGRLLQLTVVVIHPRLSLKRPKRYMGFVSGILYFIGATYLQTSHGTMAAAFSSLLLAAAPHPPEE